MSLSLAFGGPNRASAVTGLKANREACVEFTGQGKMQGADNRAQAQRYLRAVDPKLEGRKTRSTGVKFTYTPPESNWVSDQATASTPPFDVQGVIHELGPENRVAHYQLASRNEALAFATYDPDDGAESRIVEVRGNSVTVLSGPNVDDPDVVKRLRDAAWDSGAAQREPDFVSIKHGWGEEAVWLGESALAEPAGRAITEDWEREHEVITGYREHARDRLKGSKHFLDEEVRGQPSLFGADGDSGALSHRLPFFPAGDTGYSSRVSDIYSDGKVAVRTTVDSSSLERDPDAEGKLKRELDGYTANTSSRSPARGFVEEVPGEPLRVGGALEPLKALAQPGEPKWEPVTPWHLRGEYDDFDDDDAGWSTVPDWFE